MEPVQPVVKQSSFLITLLSILLSISVFIAGFFAYQTQNLVKELTKLQVVPTPVATSSPDPTADWKTYTNKKLKLELKYPPDYSIIDEGKNFVSIGPGVKYFSVTSEVKDYSKVSSCYPGRYPTGYQETYPCVCQGVILGPNNDWEELKFKNAESFCVDEGKEGLRSVEILQIYATPKIEMRLFDPFRSYDQDEVNDLFDQILSTFKLLD